MKPQRVIGGKTSFPENEKRLLINEYRVRGMMKQRKMFCEAKRYFTRREFRGAEKRQHV